MNDSLVYPMTLLAVCLVGVSLFWRMRRERDQARLQLEKASQARQDADARFNAFAKSTAAGLLMVNQEGLIRSVNRATTTLFGRTAEEFDHLPVRELLPALGELDVLASESACIELKGRCSDGRLIPVEVNFTDWRSRKGRTFGLIVRDIRVESAARQKLEHTLRLQNAILGCAGVAIITANRAGIITSANQTAELWLGFQSFEMVGKMNMLALLDPEEVRSRLAEARDMGGQADVRALFQNAWRGQIDERQWTYIGKSGQRLPVQINVTAMVGAGDEADGYLTVAHDITERLQHDRAMALALEEKDTLLKEVYHRVKNNLQVVSSLFNLQLRKLQEGPVRDALREGASRVQAMALVHEKLYQSSNLAQIDLGDYVRDLCVHLQESMGATQRGISVAVEAEAVYCGLETAVPLGLLLNELVTNSIKHAFPSGAGHIAVDIRHLDQSQCIMTISDNGVGISPEVVAQARPASLGLKLIRILASQIDAALEMRTEQGVRVEMVFPIH